MTRVVTTLLAACCFLASARAADLPVIKPKAKFQLRHEYSHPEVKVSADGRVAAIVHGGDALDVLKRPAAVIQVWELGDKPKMLSEFAGGSYCFALSPSGKLLYRTSDKYEVCDVATKKVVASGLDSPSHAHFRDDDTLIATKRSYSFNDPAPGRVTTWDIPNNRASSVFEVSDNRFDEVLLTANGKELWLFLSNGKFEVECYDLDTRKRVRTIRPEAGEKAHKDAGLYKTATRDGTAFSSNGGTPSKARVYDQVTGKIIGTLPPNHSGTNVGILPVGTLSFAVSGVRKKDGSDGWDEVGFLYDWKAEKLVAALEGHASAKKKEYNWTSRGVSADGRTLVSVTKEGEVLVYDLSSVVKK